MRKDLTIYRKKRLLKRRRLQKKTWLRETRQHGKIAISNSFLRDHLAFVFEYLIRKSEEYSLDSDIRRLLVHSSERIEQEVLTSTSIR